MGPCIASRANPSRPHSRVRLAALLLTALSLLATAPRSAGAAGTCFEGTSERLIVELLFGRNIGVRLGVSEKAFRAFLDREVTTRFPDGFTLLDSRGQFRGANSAAIVREPGKYLMIALADEAQGLMRVREIVAAYKLRFNQESVGLIARRACVAF